MRLSYNEFKIYVKHHLYINVDLTSSMALSGVASNSTTLEATSSGQIPLIPEKPPNSNDIGWKFGKFIVLNNSNDIIQGKKCYQIVKDMINWLKQHIVGIKGTMRSFPRQSDEEKSLYRLNIEATKSRRSKKKKAEYMLSIKVQITNERNPKNQNYHILGLNNPACLVH